MCLCFLHPAGCHRHVDERPLGCYQNDLPDGDKTRIAVHSGVAAFAFFRQLLELAFAFALVTRFHLGRPVPQGLRLALLRLLLAPFPAEMHECSAHAEADGAADNQKKNI